MNNSTCIVNNTQATITPRKTGKIFMQLFLLLVSLLALSPNIVHAQDAGDYRSVATGNWENINTWETFDGTLWVAAATAPSSSDGVITIRNPHTVSITQAITIDQVVVNAAAALHAFNAVVTIADGPGNDVVQNGTMFIASSGTLNVAAGAFISGFAGIQFDGNAINNGNINVQFIAWGTNPQTLTGTGSINTLSTANPAGLTLLGGNQTITNTLNFSGGNITTGPNRLILEQTAFAQNNAVNPCFVIGNLQINYQAGNVTKSFRDR